MPTISNNGKNGHALFGHLNVLLDKYIFVIEKLILHYLSPDKATSGREPSFSSSSPTTLNDSGSWAGSGILHRRSSKVSIHVQIMKVR